MTESKEHLVRLFKALGDTNRLDIVLSIGKGARSVTEIIKATGLSQTLASFHLRALREANIVTTERNGPFILYSLLDPNLDKTLVRLAKIINPNGRKGRETPEPSLQEAGKATRRWNLVGAWANKGGDNYVVEWTCVGTYVWMVDYADFHDPVLGDHLFHRQPLLRCRWRLLRKAAGRPWQQYWRAEKGNKGPEGWDQGPKEQRRKGERLMNVALRAVAVVVFLTAFAYADETVRDFNFRTVDGKIVEYKAANKMPMVVNIGAHWWPECKKEAPELQKAYQNYKSKGVGFIGVFVLSSDDDIRKFTETFKITFPVGKEKELARTLGVRGIPVTVFIDKKGRIAKRHIGMVTYADLSSNIEAVLKWICFDRGGGFLMGEKDITRILEGMTPASKKEVLDSLVVNILSDLNETEKRELLKTVLVGQKENQQLAAMVDYWIKECTDSGVNPMEMSKEVLTTVSQSFELATYSTPELRGLFNDWVGAIEQEILDFIKDKGKVDPDEIAAHFRLERGSVIFMLGKLAREEKIRMQASET